MGRSPHSRLSLLAAVACTCAGLPSGQGAVPIGIQNGSFEDDAPGSLPGASWKQTYGHNQHVAPVHAIMPVGFEGPRRDWGFPVDGTRWLEITGADTFDGTPPSHPGELSEAARNASGFWQSFRLPANKTMLQFYTALYDAETFYSNVFIDFMSAGVSDGVNNYNLFYEDIRDDVYRGSFKYSWMTPIRTTSVDLLTLFPDATEDTAFSFHIRTANGGDGSNHPSGYVDAIRLIDPRTPVSADFDTWVDYQADVAYLHVADRSRGGFNEWSWDFGDGETSDASGVVHRYTESGTYTVALRVSGPGGTDTATHDVAVDIQLPVIPAFSVTQVGPSDEVPLTLAFHNESSGNGTHWYWSFGDSESPDNLSQLESPTHTYHSSGSFTASLTVVRETGEQLTTHHEVLVGPETDHIQRISEGDSSTNSIFPNTNYGDLTVANVVGNESAGYFRKTFLEFSLPLLPIDQARTESALLTVTQNAGDYEPVHLHRALEPWSESGLTWNTEPALGSVIWATPQPGGGPQRSFDVSALLEQYSSGALEDFGWALTGNDLQSVLGFRTREHFAPKQRPKVDIRLRGPKLWASSAFVAGESTTLILRDVEPTSATHLYYSIDGLGETPILELEATAHLSNPILATVLPAGPLGHTFLLTVPTFASGETLLIQAVQERLPSNVLGYEVE